MRLLTPVAKFPAAIGRFHACSLGLVFGLGLIWPGSLSRAQVFQPGKVPVSEDYVLRTWEMDDGLPSNDIMSMAQTSEGYLWVGTSGGLGRFDGTRFKFIPVEKMPGLTSQDVNSVFVDRDDQLWIGMGGVGGVVRRVKGDFEVVAPPILGNGWINSFAQDSEGRIWFSNTGSKVFCWDQGKISGYSTNGVGNVGIAPYLFSSSTGKIWVGTDSGFGFLEGDHFKSVNFDKGNDLARRDHLRLGSGSKGSMWVSRDGIIYHLQPGETPKRVLSFEGSTIDVLYQDRAENLWIGVAGQGLFRFKEGNLIKVPTSHTNVNALCEDLEGNLWVGTAGGGLNRLRPRCFSLRQTGDGLLSENIVSLCEDTEGRIWLVGRDGLPVRALDSSNRKFGKLEDRKMAFLMNSLSDRKGGVLFGSVTNQMIHWENGVFTIESSIPSATGLLLDQKDDLWIATIDGPLIVSHEGTISTTPGIEKSEQPRALAEDTLGKIWVGTESGRVYQKEDGRFNEVPLPGYKEAEPIRFIVSDQNNTVWIGAYGGGLYRWRAGKVSHLPDHVGFETGNLRTLVIEPNGDFWFGTGKGLFRVKRSEIDAVLDGQRTILPLIHYGRNDGLPNLDFSYGFRQSGIRTRDGHLWFATSKGALEIDPAKLPVPVSSFGVLIEDMELNGSPIGNSVSESLELPEHPGPLQIHYTLPQLSVPEQTRFRYRLLGSDNEGWVEAGDQRSVTFANLPPGNYRLEVAASEASGPWLARTASLGFHVQAAWWQTGLFRAGCLVLGMILLVLLARTIILRRVRARMLLLEQQHALERERTRIARDIHDELGANLTQIHMESQLIQMDSPDTVSSRIQEINRVARGTIKLLGEIVWAINPKCDTLDSLVEYLGQYAANYLNSTGIAGEIDLPENLPSHPLTAEARHHLLLVTKEALHNIVKHARADRAGFQVKMTGNLLQIKVTDNGAGFKPGSEKIFSNGLRNMDERMKELGGTYQVESTEGQGTCVTFELRLENFQNESVS